MTFRVPSVLQLLSVSVFVLVTLWGMVAIGKWQKEGQALAPVKAVEPRQANIPGLDTYIRGREKCKQAGGKLTTERSRVGGQYFMCQVDDAKFQIMEDQ